MYRARDTRLDRTVAIKVLPEHLAKDAERRQRFEREAKALAALSHPMRDDPFMAELRRKVGLPAPG